MSEEVKGLLTIVAWAIVISGVVSYKFIDSVIVWTGVAIAVGAALCAVFWAIGKMTPDEPEARRPAAEIRDEGGPP